MINRKLAVSLALGLGLSATGATYAASPFEGPYIGAQVGHSVYDTKLSDSSGTVDGLSGRGADGGLYAGWGMLINPSIYAGVEGEYNWSGAEHNLAASGAGSFGYKDKDNFGLSARLGWLPSSNVMLYGRAGWQRASLDYSGDVAGVGAGTINKDHNGFRLGVGTEVAMAGNWAMRVDYDHTWYNKETLAPGVESEPRNDVFRVGVAYHF